MAQMNKVLQSIKDSLIISDDSQSVALITYLIVLHKILVDFKDEQEYLRAPHLITGYMDEVDITELLKSPSVETLLKQLSSFEVGVFKKSLDKYYSTVSLEKALTLIGQIDFSKDIIRGNYIALTNRFLDIQEQLIDDLGTYYSVNTPRSIIAILKGILQVKEDETCLDPCIGFGDLVVGVGDNGKSISGQDNNPLLVAIAKNNTIVAGKESFIKEGDSVSDFHFDSCDIVVGHYHFGFRFEGDQDKTPAYMEWGIPSRSGSDFYFISLILHYMKKRGATIVPEGLLFRSGKEGTIREEMIKQNLIDCVISLPPGVFKLTGVATSLLIFNREKKDEDILMIDGRSFFDKVRGGAVIKDGGSDRIIDIYRSREADSDDIKRLVKPEQLAKNGFVLSVNRYITAEMNEPSLDLKDLERSVMQLEQETNLSRNSVNEKLKQI
jgi:type I restriction enzyme M protein